MERSDHRFAAGPCSLGNGASNDDRRCARAPRSIAMPLLTAQGRMTRVAHEHRHDHASHEESRSARAGGATEHAAQGDTHAANVIYTCPMHPQIRQIGPGNCPICGMTLEPLVASTEAEPNAELIDMTRRFWIGLALAAPVLVLEMGGHLFNLHHLHCAAGIELASAHFGDAGRDLGWLAVFCSRRAVARDTQSEYVHAHRHGNGRRLDLQRHRNIGAVALPAGVPQRSTALSRSISRRRRLSPSLFCLDKFSNCARGNRPAAPYARSRSRAKNGDADQGRWIRRRSCAGSCAGRRPPARASRRKGPCRRRTSRGPQFGRQVHGHRRIHAGDQDRRRQGHRRHAQSDWRLRDARRQGWPRHRALAHRRDGRLRAAKPRANPAPRRSSLGLVRARSSSSSPFLPSLPGRSGDRSRA